MTCCQIIVTSADEYRTKVGDVTSDVKKLISNLGIKNNYVVQFRNLQQSFSVRMKLAKINRGLKLKQSDWMENYIDFNTAKRRKAANKF